MLLTHSIDLLQELIMKLESLLNSLDHSTKCIILINLRNTEIVQCYDVNLNGFQKLKKHDLNDVLHEDNDDNVIINHVNE